MILTADECRVYIKELNKPHLEYSSIESLFTEYLQQYVSNYVFNCIIQQIVRGYNSTTINLQESDSYVSHSIAEAFSEKLIYLGFNVKIVWPYMYVDWSKPC